MFGRIIQVVLKRGNEQKMFSFNERNQESGGETARVSFYTDHKALKDAIHTANIDLYNLNDETLNWIWHAGGAFVSGTNPTLTSNLHVELSVGYSNFKDDNPQMWKIFVGTANSYFNSRKGRDNITHLFCANLPWQNINKQLYINTANAAGIMSREALLKDRFMMLLANRGILQTYVTSLQRTFVSPEAERNAISTAYQRRDFIIKIRNPLFENEGNNLMIESSTNTDVIERISGGEYTSNPTPEYITYNTSPEYGNYQQWLKEMALTDPMIVGGDFERWLKTFCTNEGALYFGYNPSKSKLSSYNGSPITFVMDMLILDIPEDLIKRKEAEQLKLGVSKRNTIRNYEMLLEEPTLTSTGVEIKSLMRPWLDVEDVIKLAVDDKPIINGQERTDAIWTANIQGADNLYQSAWGTDTAIYAAVRDRARRLSFMNIPLVVYEVQHSGDTHKKDWYSQINTYTPGMAFKRNR